MHAASCNLPSVNLQSVFTDLVASDRRRHPRIDIACNALVRLSAALTFRCQVRNLSIEAAQVLCDPCYALLVHPRSGPVNPECSRALELSIALPIDGTVWGYTTRCRTKYCESTLGGSAAAAGMVMGLEFIDIEQGTRQLLVNFLGSLGD